MRACPACGEDNSERARFCQACGRTLLATIEGRTVRKPVTVLFTDIVDSTKLAERLEAEVLGDVLTRYFAAMRVCIEEHGGTVEKFIGDAIMAVFGIPIVREDDAARAVGAATEMRTALSTLNERLYVEHGIRIENRTGINTGEVIAADRHAERTLPLGDTANVAARLEQSAQPGEVLMGEMTHASVGHLIEATSMGPLTVKGKSQPLTAYRLDRLVESRGAARSMRRLPLVGRNAELERLHNVLDRVLSGVGPVQIEIIAAAGVGKSRLIDEFESRSEERVQWLHGRCAPYGEGLAYWAVGEVLRQLAGSPSADEEPSVWLHRAFDERLEEDEIGALSQALGSTGTDLTPSAIANAFSRLVADTSMRRSLVVAIEDTHWASPEFLHLVENLRTWPTKAQLLLLCTRRPSSAVTASDTSDIEEMRLHPLGGQGTRELVQVLLDGAEVSERSMAWLTEITGGNPLFIQELIPSLVRDGQLRLERGRLSVADESARSTTPPTLSSLLVARVERLTESERIAIENAAVIGRIFPRDAVPVLGGEEPLALARAVDDLIGQGLLEREPTSYAGLPAVRFHHALFANASYEATAKKRRLDLHRAFADWLEGSTMRLPMRDEILGYHLEQAFGYQSELRPTAHEESEVIGDRAAGCLAAAAERARARGEMRSAQSLLERATALPMRDERRRAEALTNLGGVLRERGSVQQAIDVLHRAHDLATSTEDESLQWQTIYYLRDAEVGYGPVDPSWAETTSAETLRWIAKLELSGDHYGLAKAWRLHALCLWRQARFDDAEASQRKAAAEASLAGHDAEEREIIAGVTSLAYSGSRPATEGLEIARSILEEVRGNRRAEAFVLISLAELEAALGRTDEARRSLERAETALDESGVERWEQDMIEVWAYVEEMSGQSDEAYALLSTMPQPESGGYLPWRLPHLMCERQSFQEALAATRSDDAITSPDVEVRLGHRSSRAWAFAEIGQEEEALTSIERVLDGLRTIQCPQVVGESLLDIASAYEALARRDAAIEALEKALTAFRRKEHLVSARITEHRIEDMRHASAAP